MSVWNSSSHKFMHGHVYYLLSPLPAPLLLSSFSLPFLLPPPLLSPPFPSLPFHPSPSLFSSLSHLPTSPPSLLLSPPLSPFLLLSSYASDDYLNHQMVRRKESLQRTLSTADSRTSTLVNSQPVSSNTTLIHIAHACSHYSTCCVVYSRQPIACV